MPLIVAGGVLGAIWAVGGQGCARRILESRRVDVVVYCDTTELLGAGENLKIFALYDSVALSPPARWLGLYQNRALSEVKTFFFYRIHDAEFNAYSVKMSSVPWGPLVRFMFLAGGKRFHVDVKNRMLKDGVLYVRP